MLCALPMLLNVVAPQQLFMSNVDRVMWLAKYLKTGVTNIFWIPFVVNYMRPLVGLGHQVMADGNLGLRR
jgi:hypothetical protein